MKTRLQQDMKDALKNHDKIRLQTIRMVLAAIKNAEIEKMHPLSDEEMAAVIQREIKIRREALEQFAQGGREDLVHQTEAELKVLEEYLPKQLDDDELKQIIIATIAEVGAQSGKEIGKVMAALMPKIRGRADGKRANAMVRELLRG
ncbi:GatB/YqeY domain-containing protein [Neomoorella humiferrea]|uniref:Glutamyl-tRNA(Gln) amidotransferase subunit E n=1 Tax=Neomoorella humiferrea TaxID=676965 RepID=A0A2T0APZ4_9FIRM|nr:GatB/YqeY domain-containing protein [Moorella humiferrea]PRR71093.1 glutamyl-tRNA(Gln) amidotransferase subunit E [Moorella humiferrea]